MSPADDRATEILADARERLDRGEVVDADVLAREHPDLADELRRRFVALQRLDRMFGRPAASEPLPPPPPAPSLVGRTLGPYRLTASLGTGGMGTVYLAAVEKRTGGLAAGDHVAVKVVHPHLLLREGFFKRFLREAEIGRRLRHENVVRTYDCDSVTAQGSRFDFLAMEYVEGQTLRALADELGKLPEELCRHVGREVTKALAAIHAADAVHRDLKPENVLITKDHVVKVMDLGVARLDEDESLRLSQTGAFVGSVRYAAPEQFRGRDAGLDGRADLYALGLVLYELATGVHPFAGDDFHAVVRRQMTEVPRPAGEVNPQLSPYFEEVLKTLLAKERELRFATADDLRVVLEEGEKSAWWRDRAVRVRAETRRPLRRIRIPRETALYGRDAEIARLRVLFEKAKAGEGQVVVVEGEAGIGKSRLVDEFVGLLQREGEDVHFLFGSYPPGGAATASGAFTTAYREHFGEETLEDALREALPQTPLLVPAFAALLRGDGAPAGAEPLTKDSIQTVFVHATRSLAGGRPTIVLIDDLHFAPEEGRGLFASLALAVPGHRILLVGTARPGLPENWLVNVERVGHVARMPLPRLGPKDLVRLLVDAFRSERLAEELSFKIAAKSDGNPFFVFEILRGLKEGQFLTQKADGTWATTQILRDIQVPSSIQDLVQARVADLDDDDRNLLDVASCCGFEFDPLLAGAVLRMERIPLLQRLAKIEKRHRLVRSAGARFVFDHHQVQEALYGGLPDLLRTEYHAAIGAALEARENTATRDPATLDGALYVDLAEHFLKGAHGTRALRYLDSALTHLERNYLNDAAVRLADRALGMPGLLTGTERARTLLRQCGSACPLDRLGRRVRQEAAAREAEHVAEAAGDEDLRGQAARALGCLLVQTARNAEAEASYRQALEIARARGDRRAECDAELGLGNVSRSLCDTRKHYERARAIAGDAGIRSGEAFATGNLGVVATWEGRFAVARNHHERALAIHSEMGNRRGEALAIGGLGIVCLEEGHLANAMEFFERRLAICREIGDRPGQAGVTVNLGIVFESRGCLTEAREYLERGIVICREVGHREFEANATTSLGEDLRIQGRLAEAREHHEQAIAIYREIGNRQDLASALHNLGCTHSESSDFASAEERLGESLSISEEIGDGRRSAKTHLALGSLRVARGDVVRGRESFARALEEASKSGFAQVETLARCHLAGHPGGDPHDAERVFASNEERLGAAERQEARFLLWQATRDPVHLAEAKRRLDFLVEHAPPDCRESMLTNVRLHREIAAAAREAGL